MRVRVCGIGLVAPGLADWPAGARVLSGREAWRREPLQIPVTELLPAAERRRAGKAIRLALACGHEAILDSGFDAGAVASVFASSDVDAENTHRICLDLNEAEPGLSPTRFHNSVQNAVSGYWTISTGSRAPTTMVMGADEILALGLLEAVSQAVQGGAPVLLVVFDVPMPDPLFATHPIEEGGAIALVLAAPAPSASSVPAAPSGLEAGDAGDAGDVGDDGDDGRKPVITLELLARAEDPLPGASEQADGPPLPGGPAGPAASASFAALKRMHPVGAALPLLSLLVPGAAGGQTRLDYDRYHSLRIVVEPGG